MAPEPEDGLQAVFDMWRPPIANGHSTIGESTIEWLATDPSVPAASRNFWSRLRAAGVNSVTIELDQGRIASTCFCYGYDEEGSVVTIPENRRVVLPPTPFTNRLDLTHSGTLALVDNIISQNHGIEAPGNPLYEDRALEARNPGLMISGGRRIELSHESIAYLRDHAPQSARAFWEAAGNNGQRTVTLGLTSDNKICTLLVNEYDNQGRLTNSIVHPVHYSTEAPSLVINTTGRVDLENLQNIDEIERVVGSGLGITLPPRRVTQAEPIVIPPSPQVTAITTGSQASAEGIQEDLQMRERGWAGLSQEQRNAVLRRPSATFTLNTERTFTINGESYTITPSEHLDRPVTITTRGGVIIDYTAPDSQSAAMRALQNASVRQYFESDSHPDARFGGVTPPQPQPQQQQPTIPVASNPYSSPIYGQATALQISPQDARMQQLNALVAATRNYLRDNLRAIQDTVVPAVQHATATIAAQGQDALASAATQAQSALAAANNSLQQLGAAISQTPQASAIRLRLPEENSQEGNYQTNWSGNPPDTRLHANYELEDRGGGNYVLKLAPAARQPSGYREPYHAASNPNTPQPSPYDQDNCFEHYAREVNGRLVFTHRVQVRNSDGTPLDQPVLSTIRSDVSLEIGAGGVVDLNSYRQSHNGTHLMTAIFSLAAGSYTMSQNPARDSTYNHYFVQMEALQNQPSVALVQNDAGKYTADIVITSGFTGERRVRLIANAGPDQTGQVSFSHMQALDADGQPIGEPRPVSIDMQTSGDNLLQLNQHNRSAFYFGLNRTTTANLVNRTTTANLALDMGYNPTGVLPAAVPAVNVAVTPPAPAVTPAGGSPSAFDSSNNTVTYTVTDTGSATVSGAGDTTVSGPQAATPRGFDARFEALINEAFPPAPAQGSGWLERALQYISELQANNPTQPAPEQTPPQPPANAPTTDEFGNYISQILPQAITQGLGFLFRR